MTCSRMLGMVLGDFGTIRRCSRMRTLIGMWEYGIWETSGKVIDLV